MDRRVSFSQVLLPSAYAEHPKDTGMSSRGSFFNDDNTSGISKKTKRTKATVNLCASCRLKSNISSQWTETYYLQHKIRRMYRKPCVLESIGYSEAPKVLKQNQRNAVQVSKNLTTRVVDSDPKRLSHLIRHPKSIRRIAEHAVTRSRTLDLRIRQSGEIFPVYGSLKDSFILTKEKLDLPKYLENHGKIDTHVRDVSVNKFCKSAPSSFLHFINSYGKTRIEFDERFAHIKALLINPDLQVKKEKVDVKDL